MLSRQADRITLVSAATPSVRVALIAWLRRLRGQNTEVAVVHPLNEGLCSHESLMGHLPQRIDQGGAIPEANHFRFDGPARLPFNFNERPDGSWNPAPIGFYFAVLWYYEELYPLVYALGGLGALSRALKAKKEPNTAVVKDVN